MKLTLANRAAPAGPNRSTVIVIIVALLSAGGIASLLMAPVSAQSSETVSTANVNAANVSIANLAFNPANITVILGVNNTVVWTNNDNTTHTVVANDNSFSSGFLNPGDVFTHTFTTAGVYEYHCSIHTFMHGSVTVLASATATETTAGSGGIPEFPFAATAVAVVTSLVGLFYVVVRRTRRG